MSIRYGLKGWPAGAGWRLKKLLREVLVGKKTKKKRAEAVDHSPTPPSLSLELRSSAGSGSLLATQHSFDPLRGAEDRLCFVVCHPLVFYP